MTLRPARKLALTTAASAALLTALLTWQAAAADSDGTGRESRPGAGAAVSDTSDTARTKTGKESPATPGKKPGKKPALCPRCPAEATIEVLSGRWKGQVVWHLLRDRTLRFHIYDLLAPSNRVQDLLNELNRDTTCIFWG